MALDLVIKRSVFFGLLAFSASGCSTLAFWRSEKPEPVDQVVEQSQPKASPEPTKLAERPSLTDEQELKLAKLWSRVDELEEEQLRHKERIRVLEKGLTLGLIPEELRREGETKAIPKSKADVSESKKALKARSKSAQTLSQDAMDPLPLAAEEEPTQAAKSESKTEPQLESQKLSKEDADEYQKMVASAHDLFRAGRYGRAIVEYSALGKRFGEEVGGGMHEYFIGKSWAGLKEYNTARQYLTEFLRNHAKSAWAPRAKLELARVEWQLGMQETAIKKLRELIQEHPYEDAAEMAKMELETLDKKL